MTKCTWLINKHNIHEGVEENDVSVKMCMCTVLLLTMVQVLYLLEVFILAYYAPPSTETPTTETTTVRCHKNSWIYLTSTYYWWLLRPTITIRFDSKLQNNSWTIQFDSKWKTIRTALLIILTTRHLTIGSQAFPVAAARAWNALSESVTSMPSVTVFLKSLKMHLYWRSY